MAGKREEWPQPFPIAGYHGDQDMRIQPAGTEYITIGGPNAEATARTITREHNMHERMLDALKLLFSTLCKGCDQYHQDRCTAVFDETGDEVDCMWGKVGNQTRDLIAEAEKGD